jgi:hypothetical protein
MLKPNNILEKKVKNPKPNGKITFQPICISWSNLYLGKIALTNINKNAIATVFMANTNSPKIKSHNKKVDQPPKNKITIKADISIMLPYSPRKNIANRNPEYSKL